MATESLISRIPRATPLSRVLRFLLGTGMVAWMAPRLAGAPPAALARVGLVVIGLTVFYAAVHMIVRRYFGWVNPWIGALIAATPVLLVAVSGPIAGAGAILYIGLSLLLIAVVGHPGCEVLAVPAVLSRQPTHLACMLFSPLDWLEGKLVGNFRSGQSNEAAPATAVDEGEGTNE